MLYNFQCARFETSKLVCLHHSACSPNCHPWSPQNATTVDSESPNSSNTFNTLQRDDHLHLLVLMLPANFIIHMGHGCVVSSPVGYNSRETLASFNPTSDPSSSNWGWSHWPPQGGGLPGNLLCSLRMPAAQPSYSRPQKACFRARRGCWGTDYMCIIWPPPC